VLRETMVAVSLTCALVACGRDTSAEPTPLTRDQATVMAEVLFRNHEAGGADFTLATPAGPGGGTITLSGEVDWAGHRGHAVVDVSGASISPTEAPLTEIWWDDEQVYERRPALDSIVASVGLAGTASIIRRPADTERRRVDQLVAIVFGLASEQPENAELIVQQTGSAFVRTDSLRGVDVDVLRYGERTVYWVNRDMGAMVRFEGSDESGRFPVVIDIIDVGARTIAFDEALDVVDLSTLPGEIASLMPSSP